MMEICLRWPPSSLSPNARSRSHWPKTRAIRSYRLECRWEAVAQGLKRIDAASLAVKYTFHPPSKRRYDRDGLIARMKSGQDGLADVLGIDDHRWVTTYEIGHVAPPKGIVVVEIKAQ